MATEEQHGELVTLLDEYASGIRTSKNLAKESETFCDALREKLTTFEATLTEKDKAAAEAREKKDEEAEEEREKEFKEEREQLYEALVEIATHILAKPDAELRQCIERLHTELTTHDLSKIRGGTNIFTAIHAGIA